MAYNCENVIWVREYLETVFSSKEKPSPAIIWDKVSKFGGKLYKYYSFEDKYSIENLKKTGWFIFRSLKSLTIRLIVLSVYLWTKSLKRIYLCSLTGIFR